MYTQEQLDQFTDDELTKLMLIELDKINAALVEIEQRGIAKYGNKAP